MLVAGLRDIFDTGILMVLVFGAPVFAVGIGAALWIRAHSAMRVTGAVIGVLGLAELALQVRFFADFCYGDEPRPCGEFYFDVVYYGWWLCVALAGLGVLLNIVRLAR